MRCLSARVVAVAAVGVLAGVPAPLAHGVRVAEAAPAGGVWSEADLWLTPGPVSTPTLGGALRQLADGDHAGALSSFTRAATHPLIGGYARVYQGRVELAMGRAEAAVSSALDVLKRAASPVLRESALWLLADALEDQQRWSEVVAALTSLVDLPSRSLPTAYLRRGRAALEADEPVVAAQSFTTLYYDFPLAAEAADAESELKRHFHWPPATATFERDDRRAERLFAARRFEPARDAFEALRATAPEASRQRIQLRLAQCDLQLGRHAKARDALRTYLDRATERLDEAGAAYLAALRGLRRDAEYRSQVQTFVNAHPTSLLAEAALNDLATYHILANDDGAAAGVFADLLQRFPTGAFAERAAWKAGWWAYRTRDYASAIARFETGAAVFPRSDYRPSWLYWAARAHAQLGHADAAASGLRQVLASYRHSYYGRRAAAAFAALAPRPTRASLSGRATEPAERSDGRPLPRLSIGTPPDNAPVIRALLAAELYDDAIAEIRRAQADRPSALLDATLALALNRKGELRAGIVAMRRAYPVFLADGGEALPAELRRVIFPIDHWELIRQYAAQRGLDPFLMAALIAQESTFQADVRSHADAWGLMQILPSTGRRIAAAMGVRGFATSRLTDPDLNLRIGMKYFQDLLAKFGGDPVSALAAYNAGENRVIRWRAERPGLDPDEFIDDIPFPETQNYVKRILGTVDDYRSLYAEATVAGGTPVRKSSR